MKKKFSVLLTLAALGLVTGSITIVSQEVLVSLAADVNASKIDYDPSKWVDKGSKKLWETDPELNQIYFDRNDTGDKEFTGNMFLSEQFDTVGATLTIVEAAFTAKVTSEDIINTSEEVHYGIVPWYLDENNWVIVYPKYARCEDPAIKDGHIFDLQCYVKLNGSTHVEYYVRQDGDKWIAANDPANNEWHSSWPDGFNANMDPQMLQDTLPDPSDKHVLKVKKTRRTFAGKVCDTFFMTIDGYELNFGRDNFNFSGLVLAEEANPEIKPMIGFYAYNTKSLVVSGISVEISHESILPLPTVEPLIAPTKNGSVGKKVYIPDFSAYSNNGDLLETSVKVTNPYGESVYLEEGEYFIPNLVGEFTVTASATDSDNLTGKYTYVIKIKAGTGHVDNNYYNDRYTPVPYDVSVDIATGIFIAVPSLIVVLIALKIVSVQLKKRKEKKVLNNDEEDE